MSRWLQFGIVVLAALSAVVPANPWTIEQRFSTGVYPLVQQRLTWVSNLAPFAVFDVITLAAATVLVVALASAARRARRQRRWALLLPVFGSMLTAAAAAYLAFLAIWGLNYRRVPMDERLVLQAEPPDTGRVVALGLEAAQRLNELHDEAHASGWLVPPVADERLRAAFATVQRSLSDAPTAVPGRLKATIYGPYFRWTSIDGMINPFALEVIANPDLLPFEKPFVAAHEWAHLAGYADESEASFVGWLTCLRAGEGARYSGWMYLYWQISGELAPEPRASLWNALEEGPRRDIQAVAERIRRGQLPALRTASWRVYDQYLRANRVEEGIRSYGAVVTLILRAQFGDGWVPVRRASPESSR